MTGGGGEPRLEFWQREARRWGCPTLVRSGSRFSPSAGQLIPGTNICPECFKVISTTCYQQEAGAHRHLRSLFQHWHTSTYHERSLQLIYSHSPCPSGQMGKKLSLVTAAISIRWCKSFLEGGTLQEFALTVFCNCKCHDPLT